MDCELRILLDERAINAVMNEYCHAMDTGRNERFVRDADERWRMKERRVVPRGWRWGKTRY